MFSANTYIERRSRLAALVGSGLVLLLGNDESPMNYLDNTYHFRQDSTFLYYFGIDQPGLAGVIDIDTKEITIFGNELTVEEIVWMGIQQTIAEKAKLAGVNNVLPASKLQEVINTAIAKGRQIHIIPQYRAENMIKLEELLGISSARVNSYASPALTKAVIAQRSVKTDEEVAEIEQALAVSYEMYYAAFKGTRPGIYEREISGMMEGIALAIGNGISFPTIFSIHGEILHNHKHDNLMIDGKMVVCDSGAESLLHYASDITRTFPVNGKFTDAQKEIYQIVLDANLTAISALKPGIKFKEVHVMTAKLIASRLKELGFLKGDVDAIVEAGAHALFFPHGLGHMLGLDVHDLENFGEQNTGYDESIERSRQFGMKSLRFGRELKPGMVLTIEPGLYFIPQLIEQWEKEGKFTEFINYEKAKSYIGFGGIRIEDNVLITENGARVLGRLIPKAIEDIEEFMAEE